MYCEIEKVEKAKDILVKMASGINPLSGEQIQGDSVLNDAGIVRCLYLATDVLEVMLKSNYYAGTRTTKFVITPEQKCKVVLPEDKIGVNQFSRCINACLDLTQSKKLTGVELNRKLKKLGILTEAAAGDGKMRTIINDRSAEYGFEAERKIYNGVEYDKVVMNNTGKKYLLENLEVIMATDLSC